MIALILRVLIRGTQCDWLARKMIEIELRARLMTWCAVHLPKRIALPIYKCLMPTYGCWQSTDEVTATYRPRVAVDFRPDSALVLSSFYHEFYPDSEGEDD